MAIICSDGSCKRNGKPDCISSYGVVVYSNEGELLDTFAGSELNSTSQRGELYGMLKALKVGLEYNGGDVFIVTDSAYIANCINGKWYEKWQRVGWITVEGTAVKNKDIWEQIVWVLKQYRTDSLFVYLIKGHIKMTDETSVKDAVQKFAANNNGVVPPLDIFYMMLKGNALADEVASSYVKEKDKEVQA